MGICSLGLPSLNKDFIIIIIIIIIIILQMRTSVYFTSSLI